MVNVALTLNIARSRSEKYHSLLMSIITELGFESIRCKRLCFTS